MDGPWTNTASGLLYDEKGTLTILDEPTTNNSARYYRVRAIQPLSE